MGEAKRRRAASENRFDQLNVKLTRSGVDTSRFGFYDQPAFLALEQADPIALELYSSWVLTRARDAAYDDYARATVRRLADIIEKRLSAAGAVGACVNVATVMARMLDRLGVWSFAARGSLTIEIPSQPDVGRRYFPECDIVADPEAVTGHGWLVTASFIVVDTTLRHQKWVDLHPAIAALLPAVVASEAGEVVRPPDGLT